MHELIKKGNTVLLQGPASATIIEGETTVLGWKLAIGDQVIVRKGKSFPFEALENSVIDIFLGSNAKIIKLKGSTIPNSWKKVVEDILAQQKPCTIIVLGDVDSGKTTFSTYLINRSLECEFKPSIIDADLGQSDIGPPTTVGLSLIFNPIADLFMAKPSDIFFTGLTSPKGITPRVILAFEFIMGRVLKEKVDLIVINTDGWVRGEEACSFKTSIIKKVHPDIIIGIQIDNELEPILHTVSEEGYRILRITPAPTLKRRGHEERQGLREQSYRKYMGRPILRKLPLKWIKIEYTPLGSGNILEVEEITKILRTKIVHCEASQKELFIVIEKNEKINEDLILTAKKLFQKNIYIVKDGDEKGLLVSLLNEHRYFLCLGIVHKIDYKNGIIKLITFCNNNISIVQFGQIKIDTSGKELGICKSFSNKINS